MANLKINRGKIIDIKKNKILVELTPDFSGCGGCRRCKPLAFEDNPSGPKIWITSKEKFSIGEEIKIEGKFPSPYTGIFFIFILPIFSLLLGAFLGDHASHSLNAGIYKKFMPEIMAFIFFSLAIGLAIIYEFFFKKNDNIFKVYNSLSKELNENSNCSREIRNIT